MKSKVLNIALVIFIICMFFMLTSCQNNKTEDEQNVIDNNNANADNNDLEDNNTNDTTNNNQEESDRNQNHNNTNEDNDVDNDDIEDNNTNDTTNNNQEENDRNQNDNTNNEVNEVKDIYKEYEVLDEYTPDEYIDAKIEINKKEIVNEDIIGPGVNFDFSAFIPINLENGNEYGKDIRSQHIPYGFGVEEFEAKEWENYFELMDYMDFEYVRMSVSLTQWEPINDNDDPHDTDFDSGFVFSPNFSKTIPENTHLYMETMYKILDYFEENGKYVIIANWDRGSSGFCPDRENWISKKKEDGTYYRFDERDDLYITDLEEYTESLAAIMYHLKIEKGYECVKGISFWNEPESFLNFEENLVKVYNSLGKQLKRLGIRDKVLIQAYDGAVFWNAGEGWVRDQVESMLDKCGEYMDIISIHNYNAALDYDINNSRAQGTISNFLVDDFIKPALEQSALDQKDRIVVLGEIGTHVYGDTEASEPTFMQRLHNAQATIAGLNNNVKAFGYWVYNHTFHTHYRMLEFDDTNKHHFVPDDTNYYPVALLSRYMEQGWDIANTKVSLSLDENNIKRVHATTALNEENTTILIVNDSFKPAKVQIDGIDQSGKYSQYFVYEGKRDRISKGNDFIPKQENSVMLRPRSITAITNYEK